MWCLLKRPWSIPHVLTGKDREGRDTHAPINTHTHTHGYTLLLNLVRLLAGSHYLEQTGMECVCDACVYVCKSRVGSVKGCQLVEMGEVVPNESPRSEGPLLTAANFTWHCRAAAEHGLATNRHASVSIRRKCPLSGGRMHTFTQTLYTGSGLVSGFPHCPSPRRAPDPDQEEGFT